MLRLRHCKMMGATAYDGVAEDNLLHRFLWFNPRATSQCETIADMNTHLQTEGVGLCQRIVNQSPEIITEGIGLAVVFGMFLIAPDRHEVTASQASILHGLQVGLDALLCDGTIHPIPKSPGFRGFSNCELPTANS